ncbi:nitrilase-related carbon-nitrogen hydrolase [Stomatohabitans albus]|uniref:nitrilase-related carbon-nitrogen hydrolase n=1 Tax=Stomatohabitans albus TaxID=3110766 RepID=UPI00300C58B4
MSSGQLRVAGIQIGTVWNDVSANLAANEVWINRAGDYDAGLVVLSELFSTGFIPEHIEAQREDGQVLSWMQTQAAANDLVVAATVFMQRADRERPTNTCVFMGPDGILGMYDKARPFSLAGEGALIEAGTQPLTVDIDGVRVTPFVCYDLRFPGLFWNTALTTDLFIIPANWPSSRAEQWTALLRARAIETQAYVLGVNRIGADGNHIRHSGQSAVFDPIGNQVVAFGEQEGLVIADVDANRVERLREQFPIRNDR